MSLETTPWIFAGCLWGIWLLWILADALADTRASQWLERRWDSITCPIASAWDDLAEIIRKRRKP